MKRGGRFSAVALLAAMLGGCSWLGISSPAREEVLLELPDEPITIFAHAPDGTLFFGTPTGLYRSTDRSRFEKVGDTPGTPIKLSAPSRDLAFGITNNGWLFRWRSSTGAEQMAIPYHMVIERHEGAIVAAMDLDGSDSTDVVVVGPGAMILRLRGSVWTLDANPLDAWADSASPKVFHSYIWSVARRGSRLWAGGFAILTWSGAGWDSIPVPQQMGADALAAVALPDGVAFSSSWFDGAKDNNSVVIYQGGRWRAVPVFSGYEIVGGAPQIDGHALFWDLIGSIVEVGPNGVTTRALPWFGRFAGAASVGRYLYYAGSRSGLGVVARIGR